MKKDGKLIISALIVVMSIILIVSFFVAYVALTKKNDEKEINQFSSLNESKNEVKNEIEVLGGEWSEEIDVVPTMYDEIKGDATWCPTFQLVWNDMKNEVVKQEVEFVDGDVPAYLENLNGESFTEKDISEEYYYKMWGIKSNDLKEEILTGIEEKFGESSEVIDENEDWDEWKEKTSEEEQRYIFYSMLKKTFNFEKPFDKLENGLFKVDEAWVYNVKYFGIDDESADELKNQVTILYYNSSGDFAVSVKTKEGDEVIFARGVEGENFAEIYEKIQKNSDNYDEETAMVSGDTLKIPNLKFNVLKDYEELTNKIFYNSEGDDCWIAKALQTIKFEMDNEGGKIKSEAVIEMVETASLEEPEEKTCKELELTGEFVMFVKESEKDLPYFALKVSDISKFQDEVSEESNDMMEE